MGYSAYPRRSHRLEALAARLAPRSDTLAPPPEGRRLTGGALTLSEKREDRAPRSRAPWRGPPDALAAASQPVSDLFHRPPPCFPTDLPHPRAHLLRQRRTYFVNRPFRKKFRALWGHPLYNLQAGRRSGVTGADPRRYGELAVLLGDGDRRSARGGRPRGMDVARHGAASS